MSEMKIAIAVEEVAKMISGAPFPSKQSLSKARRVVEHLENTRAPQWLPIESAPRDGSWIILGRAGHGAVLLAFWHRLHSAWRGQGGDDGQWKTWQQATHWQPLPAPPEVQP